MRIRPARSSDYDELMVLYNEFVGEDRYSSHSNDSYFKVLSSKNSFIFVVEEQKHIIAFATFSIRTIVRYKTPIAELEELYVRPEYRRKGVGRLLLDKILFLAKKKHCNRLYIASHLDRKEAHVFYKRLGFTNYGFHFKKDILG